MSNFHHTNFHLWTLHITLFSKCEPYQINFQFSHFSKPKTLIKISVLLTRLGEFHQALFSFLYLFNFWSMIILSYNMCRLSFMCLIRFVSVFSALTLIFFLTTDCRPSGKIYYNHDEHWSDTCNWISDVRLVIMHSDCEIACIDVM